VIDTRVDVAWALLMNPAAWGGVFDMRVGSIDPPGPRSSNKRSAARQARDYFI
jgi:hypothetical protein